MIDVANTTDPDWGNGNALRAYPLMDDASAASVIPTWLLSDMHITVSDVYEKVFVSSAYFSDTIISIGVSGTYTEIREGEPVTVIRGLLTCTVTRDELEPYRTYSMDRISEDATGSVAFGEPPHDASPFKITVRKPEEAELIPAAVNRIPVPGVTAIVDRDHGLSATGIIDLSGNPEFRTYVNPEDPQEILVRLSDTYRDGTTSVCSAVPSKDRCGRTPVTSINGVHPDDTGLLKLRFV